jgi:predicted ArsR family transcriptional regulator
MSSFAHTHSRRSDPATSYAAASLFELAASEHQRLILAHLRRIYPHGATLDEIADATPLDKWAVGRRMKELEQKKLAQPSGEVRALKSGRMGRVWRYVRP